MTVEQNIPDDCPIDHKDDPDLVKRFYRTVSYRLPKVNNINVLTVHRCNVSSEVGSIITSATSGDGGTAAVIVKDGVNLGVVYIENKRQAEAVCDIITSVVMREECHEVSQMLLGQQSVQYIKDVLL